MVQKFSHTLRHNGKLVSFLAQLQSAVLVCVLSLAPSCLNALTPATEGPADHLRDLSFAFHLTKVGVGVYRFWSPKVICILNKKQTSQMFSGL